MFMSVELSQVRALPVLSGSDLPGSTPPPARPTSTSVPAGLAATAQAAANSSSAGLGSASLSSAGPEGSKPTQSPAETAVGTSSESASAQQISVAEAIGLSIPGLLDRVQRGEEFVITRRGKPIAALVRFPEAAQAVPPEGGNSLN